MQESFIGIIAILSVFILANLLGVFGAILKRRKLVMAYFVINLISCIVYTFAIPATSFNLVLSLIAAFVAFSFYCDLLSIEKYSMVSDGNIMMT